MHTINVKGTPNPREPKMVKPKIKLEENELVVRQMNISLQCGEWIQHNVLLMRLP